MNCTIEFAGGEDLITSADGNVGQRLARMLAGEAMNREQ